MRFGLAAGSEAEGLVEFLGGVDGEDLEDDGAAVLVGVGGGLVDELCAEALVLVGGEDGELFEEGEGSEVGEGDEADVSVLGLDDLGGVVEVVVVEVFFLEVVVPAPGGVDVIFHGGDVEAPEEFTVLVGGGSEGDGGHGV